ncbi:hypothetical protein P152DRAFT_453606 [Eremomyces bilateralis CBS 781.70]|uniref:Uncharacterized protein n=1 Tax=Eremomyces bilateralis CBS 781.70 TaxID=1392243 RepID=A0A6G1GGK0_9PEZI|nr:uncharacterized protein P152DRAFT_453606 [Eremomyces bilateralis CBS 781.70]KAF1816999.1 hypothetical protein P152DRAFT_453606 [Eremomyces bilateralis CBS 781.70]
MVGEPLRFWTFQTYRRHARIRLHECSRNSRIHAPRDGRVRWGPSTGGSSVCRYLVCWGEHLPVANGPTNVPYPGRPYELPARKVAIPRRESGIWTSMPDASGSAGIPKADIIDSASIEEWSNGPEFRDAGNLDGSRSQMDQTNEPPAGKDMKPDFPLSTDPRDYDLFPSMDPRASRDPQTAWTPEPILLDPMLLDLPPGLVGKALTPQVYVGASHLGGNFAKETEGNIKEGNQDLVTENQGTKDNDLSTKPGPDNIKSGSNGVSAIENDVRQAFKRFAEQKYRTQARISQSTKLSELKKCGDSFKLHTPIADDLRPILGIDKIKRQQDTKETPIS